MKKEDIINLIPSESLKSAIKVADFRLSDYCLFKIGYLYSKSLKDRISICNLFINNVDNDLNTHIKNIYKELLRCVKLNEEGNNADVNLYNLSFEEELLIDRLSWLRIKLPIFFKDMDVVKFGNEFGMVVNDQKAYFEAVAEVIPLDSPYINEDMDKPNKYGLYSVLEHVRLVPFCELEVIESKSIPGNVQDKYKKLLEFYKWFELYRC